MYTTTCNRQPEGSCFITQGAQPGALWQPEGWDGIRGGNKVRKGGDLWLIHTVVWRSQCNIVKYPPIKNKLKKKKPELSFLNRNKWTSVMGERHSSTVVILRWWDWGHHFHFLLCTFLICFNRLYNELEIFRQNKFFFSLKDKSKKWDCDI